MSPEVLFAELVAIRWDRAAAWPSYRSKICHCKMDLCSSVVAAA